MQVSATTYFTAGEYALIWESDLLQELVILGAHGTGPTRVTTTTAIKNSYTTGGWIIPLFRSVAYVSGASGSGNVDFFALTDRTIAL